MREPDTTPPICSLTICTDREVVHRVRLRLGFPPCDTMQSVYPVYGQDLTTDPHHYISCAYLVVAPHIFTHNLIVVDLMNFSSLMVSAVISVESRIPCRRPAERSGDVPLKELCVFAPRPA
jgi:hypothetical protein